MGRPIPPNLKGPKGENLCGAEDLDGVWMQHFGAMEHGRKISTEELLNSVPCLEPLEESVLDKSTMLTLQDVEDVFRKAPAGKAMGLDLVPSEFFKSAPREMSKLYYSLFLEVHAAGPDACTMGWRYSPGGLQE